MSYSKNKKSFFLKFLTTSFVFIFSLLFVEKTEAASLYISPSAGEYKVGDIINVSLLVDSQNTPINSAEANISFPSNLLSVVSTSKASSIFTFWVQEPTFSNVDGTIELSGGLPTPGYKGSNGNILNISFRVKKTGNAPITIASGSVRANDGLGTDVLRGTGQSNLSLNDKKVDVVVDETIPQTEVPDVVSQPTVTLTVKEISNSDKNNPQKKFSIKISSKKNTLVGRYEIQIDNEDPAPWVDDGSHVFETDKIEPGEHLLTVNAYDKNGKNLASSLSKFSIIPLLTPTILYYKKDLITSDNITIVGTTLPMKQVMVYLSKENESPKVFTIQSDQNGGFVFSTDAELSKGVYTVWAQVADLNGAKSLMSSKINIKVSNPVVEKFSLWSTNILSVLIVAVSLLSLLLFIILFSWRKYVLFKKRVHKEMQGVDKDIHKAFDNLKDDIAKQVKMIKKAKTERELTSEEEKILKQLGKSLDSAEKFIQKRISPIEKDSE